MKENLTTEGFKKQHPERVVLFKDLVEDDINDDGVATGNGDGWPTTEELRKFSAEERTAYGKALEAALVEHCGIETLEQVRKTAADKRAAAIEVVKRLGEDIARVDDRADMHKADVIRAEWDKQLKAGAAVVDQKTYEEYLEGRKRLQLARELAEEMNKHDAGN